MIFRNQFLFQPIFAGKRGDNFSISLLYCAIMADFIMRIGHNDCFVWVLSSEKRKFYLLMILYMLWIVFLLKFAFSF